MSSEEYISSEDYVSDEIDEEDDLEEVDLRDSDEYTSEEEEDDDEEEEQYSSENDIYPDSSDDEDEDEEGSFEEDEDEEGSFEEDEDEEGSFEEDEDEEDEDEEGSFEAEMPVPQTSTNILPAITPNPPLTTQTKTVTLQVSKPAVSKEVAPTEQTPSEQKPSKQDIAKAVQKIEERPEIVKPPTTAPADLESLLIKRTTETPELFAMRRAYAYAAKQVLADQINDKTAVLLAEVATNKAVYGVTYPTEISRVLDYINNKITR